MAAVLAYAWARMRVRPGRQLLALLGIVAAAAMVGASVTVAYSLNGGFEPDRGTGRAAGRPRHFRAAAAWPRRERRLATGERTRRLVCARGAGSPRPCRRQLQRAREAVRRRLGSGTATRSSPGTTSTGQAGGRSRPGSRAHGGSTSATGSESNSRTRRSCASSGSRCRRTRSPSRSRTARASTRATRMRGGSTGWRRVS